MGLEDIIGATVKGKGGVEVAVSSIAQDAEVIGLYFSAHWCPPCRGFTPLLADFYNKCKADGKHFEVIFISSDKDEEQFNSYYESMPWLTIGWDEDKKAKLSQKYGIRGIPTLIVLDKEGNTKSTEGRQLVQSQGDQFPWNNKN